MFNLAIQTFNFYWKCIDKSNFNFLLNLNKDFERELYSNKRPYPLFNFTGGIGDDLLLTKISGISTLLQRGY